MKRPDLTTFDCCCYFEIQTDEETRTCWALFFSLLATKAQIFNRKKYFLNAPLAFQDFKRKGTGERQQVSAMQTVKIVRWRKVLKNVEISIKNENIIHFFGADFKYPM